jgi:hypothetical protein
MGSLRAGRAGNIGDGMLAARPMRIQLLLASLPLLLVACGGKVSVEGASDAPPSDTAGAVAACTPMCDRRTSDGCEPMPVPCETWCPEIAGYIGRCSGAYRDLLECHTAGGFDAAQGCAQSACADLGEALHACFYPAEPCGHEDCGVIEGAKVCDVYCSSGAVYESSCTFGTTPVTCTCTFEGQTVGTCEMSHQYEPSCCVQYFALAK